MSRIDFAERERRVTYALQLLDKRPLNDGGHPASAIEAVRRAILRWQLHRGYARQAIARKAYAQAARKGQRTYWVGRTARDPVARELGR